ncbi:shikimate dehydrogenase [Oribacterium sp. C9]|uniref:shikimate dehydrogenase n=1 Tax=Oribacterium sp. C9 TaxID=1943579 RepID=UPI0009901439|nr:shikimate dehydrogenase [Oribacterium sp. C9]OON85823.1 shikimate dehydrogenase [Oribacterium sp. C9]
MEISGRTKMICLLGSPVAHSLSPAMHNEGFKQLNLDYSYLAFDIKEGELQGVLDSFKRMGVRGFNLTMPLKTEMVSLCDKMSTAAEIAGTVNTVVIEEDGTVTGHTTDGIGFTESARQSGVDFAGKKVTLLGTGGAGIAILVQLALDGAGEVTVFERAGSRFKDRTAKVVSELNSRTSCRVNVLDYDDSSLKKEISESALLINATNVGMAPNTEGNLIKDASWLTERAPGITEPLAVSDVIYNPRKTKLLEMAEECGLNAFNGMYMLLYQGAAAFELWTGQKMPVEIVKEKYFKI